MGSHVAGFFGIREKYQSRIILAGGAVWLLLWHSLPLSMGLSVIPQGSACERDGGSKFELGNEVPGIPDGSVLQQVQLVCGFTESQSLRGGRGGGAQGTKEVRVSSMQAVRANPRVTRFLPQTKGYCSLAHLHFDPAGAQLTVEWEPVLRRGRCQGRDGEGTAVNFVVRRLSTNQPYWMAAPEMQPKGGYEVLLDMYGIVSALPRNRRNRREYTTRVECFSRSKHHFRQLDVALTKAQPSSGECSPTTPPACSCRQPAVPW